MARAPGLPRLGCRVWESLGALLWRGGGHPRTAGTWASSASESQISGRPGEDGREGRGGEDRWTNGQGSKVGLAATRLAAWGWRSGSGISASGCARSATETPVRMSSPAGRFGSSPLRTMPRGSAAKRSSIRRCTPQSRAWLAGGTRWCSVEIKETRNGHFSQCLKVSKSV